MKAWNYLLMIRKENQRTPSRKERGQAIILIALAVVGVVAIVGLMMDGGILLLEYDKLKRSVDAGAISASLQFREGYTPQELEDAAEQLFKLNEVNMAETDLTAETCDTNPGDPELCTTPPRKLVRIKASEVVHFSFLKVLGINTTSIATESIGEAASVDLVLVLDASQSMAAEGGGDPSRNDDPLDDPSQCNLTNTCHPFAEIKAAATALIQQLFYPYDRVAIVTFDRNPRWWVKLSDTEGDTAEDAETELVTAIGGLTVFQPPPCVDPLDVSQTHCLVYDETGTFIGFEYPLYRAGPDGVQGTPDDSTDPSSLPSSNIGGGLGLAGEMFSEAREDSLWVVVALAGGPANTGCTHTTSSYSTDCNNKFVAAHGRICPGSPGNPFWVAPLCRDTLAQVRRADTDSMYDADDYARDMADLLSDPEEVGAVIFTIGLGNLMVNSPNPDIDAGALPKACANENFYNQPGAAGERLMCYVAEYAGGENANHGTYHFAPDATGLQQIFLEIADNIAIRLSQ